MSFATILRRSLPTWLLLAVPVSATAGGAWQAHAPLPEPRTEVAAGAARGEIVAVGGFTADGGNTARVDAYSIAGNRWRRLPDLPVAVDHAAAASASGNVYVAGGYGGDRNPLRAAFVLGRDETWRKLPALPDARAAAAAAIAGGKLYVLGGVDGRRSLARVAFAPEDAALGAKPRPAPREHLAAAAAGTRVYALGGRSAGIDTNTNRFEVELRSKRWRRVADLPTPRHGLGVVAHAGRVYAVAGGPQPGLTVSGAVESLRP